MIQFVDVTFSYKQESSSKKVLDHLNISFPKGSPISLMGGSGSGKTTILRLIMGLETPDYGQILGMEDQRCSIVFQEDRLLPHLTVLENIQLVRPQLAVATIQRLLLDLGLADTAHLYPSVLSGGMKRRVAIARCLSFDANLFLMDEPLKGLDHETRKKTAEVIRHYTAGKTLIAVVHHQDEQEYLLAGALTRHIRTVSML